MVSGRVPLLQGQYAASTQLGTTPTPDPSRTKGYSFPFAVAPADAPGRVSQVPDCSFDTRRPQSPRRVRLVHMLVASQTLAGFAFVGRLATLKQSNEAESGSLLTAHVFTFRRSTRRLAPPPAQSAT